MAKIREDLVGSVFLSGGVVLRGGDVVPDGVTVGDHVLAPEEKPEPVAEQPADDEGEKPAPKRRGRPRKED